MLNRLNKHSDERLIQAYAAGDAKAFARLYDRHKQGLYHFLYRQLSRRELCEEISQETWMAVIRQANSYQNTAKFRTWLFRIAHNKVVDYWRRQQHRSKVKVVDELDQLAAVSDDLDESIRLQELAQQLESLSAEQLATVLLKVQGFSYAEIAEITQAKKETVKSRLRYANKHLRASMEVVL